MSKKWLGEAAGWSVFLIQTEKGRPRGEKAGKYHFRRLRPEYLQRQSRWDSSDIKQKRRHACLRASVELNLKLRTEFS